MQMKFSPKHIPASYYGAIAAAILLLAWSVDNLIQKRITAAQSVLSEFSAAQLQANYQRSTLHYIADIRATLNSMTPEFPTDTSLDLAMPMEFQSLNSGRFKLARDSTLRMQDFRLAGEIHASVFDGVQLPHDIRSQLDEALNGWREYTSSLSIQLGKTSEYAQSVMLRKYGGTMPTLEDIQALKNGDDEPSQEDVDKLDALFNEFWKIFQQGYDNIWESNLNDASNLAVEFVAKRQRRLGFVSNLISATYIGLFLIGSAISIIAAIKRGASSQQQ